MAGLVRYIRGLELPVEPARARGDISSDAEPVFGVDPQALVVNSQMAEFDSNVPMQMRPTISYALLLGQLAADRATAGSSDPWKWFNAYKSVMGRIGWIQTVDEVSEQLISDQSSEVHKAILPILTAVLGPAAAASSIIIKVLEGLGSMSESAPWMTLFQRKSQTVNAAKFGLSFIDAGESGGALLKSVFFGIEAKQTLTQVLFFRVSMADASIKGARSQYVASAQSLSDAKEALNTKVQPFIAENIVNIVI